ncbi:MAG: hypothetical protein ACE5Q6_14775 [Dehalococcoidia bacterium]
MAREYQIKHESGLLNGLTPIPQSIHCAATDETYVNEQDQIDIDNFLDALAEVALAIVTRKLARSKGEE